MASPGIFGACIAPFSVKRHRMECVYITYLELKLAAPMSSGFSLKMYVIMGRTWGLKSDLRIFSDTYWQHEPRHAVGFYKSHFSTLLSGRLMHVTECVIVQVKQVMFTVPDSKQVLSYFSLITSLSQTASQGCCPGATMDVTFPV